MKRSVSVTNSSLYLTEDLPVFVNRVSESFLLEQHQHEFIEFNYVSEGKGYHYVEGSIIPVVKGDFFYLPIGVSHVFRPSTPEPTWGRLIVYNCIFNTTFASRLLMLFAAGHRIRHLLETPFPEQAWLHLHDQDGIFQHIFNVMFEEFQLRKLDYIPLVQAEIIKLLVHMSRMHNPQEDEQKPPSSQHRRETDTDLDIIVKRIQQQPAERFNTKHFADEIGISDRHFRRRFKERYSMTFMEYVHKCRIELSCHLLRQTTDSLTIIAQLAGYKDLKFYNNLFKKITGTTPHAYRTHAGDKRSNCCLEIG